jgi:hypothetical protein
LVEHPLEVQQAWYITPLASFAWARILLCNMPQLGKSLFNLKGRNDDGVFYCHNFILCNFL